MKSIPEKEGSDASNKEKRSVFHADDNLQDEQSQFDADNAAMSPGQVVDAINRLIHDAAKNPIEQPAWALESDDSVVQFLVKSGTHVNRANYIRVAFMGDQDEDGLLTAEYEAGLPEPLRVWDQDGNRRDISKL